MLEVGLLAHLLVPPLLRWVTLVLEEREPRARLLADQAARALHDHVSHVRVGALLDDRGTRVEYPLTDTIVEFGLEALGKVLEPVEMREEISLLFVFSTI